MFRPACRIVSGNYFAVSCQSTCESPQQQFLHPPLLLLLNLDIPSRLMHFKQQQQQRLSPPPIFSCFLFPLSLCPIVHPATSAENPSQTNVDACWVTHSQVRCSQSSAPSSLLFIPFLFPFPFRSRVEFTLRILNYCVHIKIGQTLIIYLFKWSWAKLLQTDDSPPLQSLYLSAYLPACSSLLPLYWGEGRF